MSDLPEPLRQKLEAYTSAHISPRRVPWMIVVAILMIVGAALTALAVSERKHREAVASGIPTVAQVLRIDDGSCLVGDKSSDCVRLSLELHPKDKPAYRAELTEKIKHRFMSRVQPGCWLTVAVNPQRPGEVLFDEESMSVAPPAPIASGR